jgi:hypothetical protein
VTFDHIFVLAVGREQIGVLVAERERVQQQPAHSVWNLRLTTCNPAMTAAIPPACRHSRGVIDPFTRAHRDDCRNDTDAVPITCPLSGSGRLEQATLDDDCYARSGRADQRDGNIWRVRH